MSEVKATSTPIVVFVVEDEVAIQDLLLDPLEEAGYQVLVASTGAEAMKMLESEHIWAIGRIENKCHMWTTLACKNFESVVGVASRCSRMSGL